MSELLEKLKEITLEDLPVGGSTVDLSSRIGEIPLGVCLMNASGARCTTQEELVGLDNGGVLSGAVVSKSCTQNTREGNPEPRYWELVGSSGEAVVTINSTGLANHGYEFYRDISSIVGSKPYIISVAGMSLSENQLILLNLVQFETNRRNSGGGENEGIAGIELNLSCPNVVGKPQVGYDFGTVKGWFDLIFNYEKIGDYGIPVGLKLPPYFDPAHINQMVELIKWVNSCGRLRNGDEFGNVIQWVTCCNSLGNCLIIDPESESVVIHPKGGLGGIGGQTVKYVALSNVYQFSSKFREVAVLEGNPELEVHVIGCGGVVSGLDAFEHILAGASAIQIGSQLMVEGLGCFNRILSELRDIMKSKGYCRLSDFRGKLKTI